MTLSPQLPNPINFEKPTVYPQFDGSSRREVQGIAFGDTQRFDILGGIDAIRDKLRNILFFKKGDYPDDPNFGVGLQTFLFENRTTTLNIALQREIRAQVSRYESRASVNRINIFAPDWDEEAIVIDLEITALGQQFIASATANGGLSFQPV